MKRRVWVYRSAIGAAIIIAVLFWARDAQLAKTKVLKSTGARSNPTAVGPPVMSAAPAVNPPSKEKTAQALRTVFEQLVKQRTVRELSRAEKYLQEEVTSGDEGRILRAFHDIIYSRSWTMNQAIPVLKRFLTDQNLYVRYLAAQDPVTVGDYSGVPTLLDLVRAPNASLESVKTFESRPL